MIYKVFRMRAYLRVRDIISEAVRINTCSNPSSEYDPPGHLIFRIM
jgi:hypothetical protein